jgi:hypothetical protein
MYGKNEKDNIRMFDKYSIIGLVGIITVFYLSWLAHNLMVP